MFDPVRADAGLADALWWLKGFAAAQGSLLDGGSASDAADMANTLREVRIWLNRLATGKTRLLGTSERERAVAITEGELEILLDGIRDGGKFSPSEADRALAQVTICNIFEEMRHEARRLNDVEAPF